MNIDVEKSEILSWLQKLQDSELIHKVLLLKKESEKAKGIISSKRKAGDGKYLIEYIAEDFNDPIDHFDEDTKP
jgi:hypothetical protein